MTLKQFFAALETYKNQFVWKVKEKGQIRATSPQHVNSNFCLWTALAMAHGQRYPVYRFKEGASWCGIEGPLVDRLANIADGYYENEDKNAAKLRLRLEKCLGLEEVIHG